VARSATICDNREMSDSSPLETDLIRAVVKAFAPGGMLTRAVKGFRSRASQIEYAKAIAEAIERQVPLIAEAGTGTGKTFGYLVPAMLAGGKIIISTATKTLQDQLYTKDIPAVRDALGLPVTLALLKGRSNYICHFHLDRNVREGTFADRYVPVHLRRIQKWARYDAVGDRNSLSDVPETSQAWAFATSTTENCLGSKCERYADCFVMKARRQAIEADLVVVNHHLFFADMMLRDASDGELLPMANTVVFDEAHHLPSIATDFFGATVSSSQIIELARDVRMAAAANVKDYRPLPDAANAVDIAARDLRLVFSLTPKPGPADVKGGPRIRAREKISRDDLLQHEELARSMHTLELALVTLEDELSSQAERSEEFTVLEDRAAALRTGLHAFAVAIGVSASAPGNHDRAASAVDPNSKPAALATVAGDEATTVNPRIIWAELFSQAVSFHNSPLQVGPMFREQIEKQPRNWIFTSATLSVRGDFSHFQRELNLDHAATASWESPFDYAQNALLYVPEKMPQANAPEFIDAVAQAALPVIIAAGGRTFLLCTSLKAMHRIGVLLREAMTLEGYDFPVLVQGEASKMELLTRFRRAGNAILVASQSFWEGVDVRGDALSLVVIDKLPFAVPDDPVLEARMEHINRAGGSAFFDLQLPQAVITLKQGVGRLIRDDTDRGVMMICDTRLVDKTYGKRIWRSLPPFSRTRNADRAIAFFANPPSTAASSGYNAEHSLAPSKAL
jgi:ATP-dependent DNA helicase DinG